VAVVLDPERPNVIRFLSESKPVALSEHDDPNELSPL